MKLEILNQGSPLPLQLCILDNVDEQFLSILDGAKQSDNNETVFVCGSGGNTRRILQKKLSLIGSECSFERKIFYVENGTLEEVCKLDEMCAKLRVGNIIAVGGGKVIDAAKSIKLQRQVNLTVVPTALSSDCIASPVAVLRDSSGKSFSRPGGMPDAILIDLGITKSAPVGLTLSGVGDIFSNISAGMDFRDNREGKYDTRVGFAGILSESAYRMITGLKYKDLNTSDGQKRIAEGLVLSGLAMAFAGDSSPCSGGEHLISHAIDALQIGKSTHGLQVAVGTVFCMALRSIIKEDKSTKSIIEFMLDIGLPISHEDIGISKRDFLRAIEFSPLTRPNRVTIMSKNWSISDYNLALSIVDGWKLECNYC